MVKVKLINRFSGIGKDSGKPYCRVTLASDKPDETRVVGDFWLNPSVASKVATIKLDSEVYVSADIDANLHFSVSDTRPADTTKA